MSSSWKESDVSYYVAPSGESCGGNLTESNGSLPPGGWLKVTCWPTACRLYNGISSRQGRRSLWDRGTCPPIFMKGEHPW